MNELEDNEGCGLVGCLIWGLVAVYLVPAALAGLLDVGRGLLRIGWVPAPATLDSRSVEESTVTRQGNDDAGHTYEVTTYHTTITYTVRANGGEYFCRHRESSRYRRRQPASFTVYHAPDAPGGPHLFQSPLSLMLSGVGWFLAGLAWVGGPIYLREDDAGAEALRTRQAEHASKADIYRHYLAVLRDAGLTCPHCGVHSTEIVATGGYFKCVNEQCTLRVIVPSKDLTWPPEEDAH